MSSGGAPRDTGALVRRVRLDRAQALFDEMRALDHIEAPEARELERALLDALARDRELFSDVLEASFAISALSESAYRFSYAFPGFAPRPSTTPATPPPFSSSSLPPPPSLRPSSSRSPSSAPSPSRSASPSPRPLSAVATASPMAAAAVASALACAAPFGAAVVAATRRLLRAATDPAVEQPLIGLAWDRAGAPRHKVYLQFRDRETAAARDLAERVLGMRGLAARIGDGRLHMLGVDFGPGGLTGAKLYLAHERLVAIAPSSSPSVSAPSSSAVLVSPGAGAGALLSGACVALGRALAPGREVTNVLTVHRLTGTDGGAAGLPAPSDVDFGLADNDLSWDELAAAPEIAGLLARSRVAPALFSRFRLAVRRLSIGTASALRVTVYHGLREVEEP